MSVATSAENRIDMAETATWNEPARRISSTSKRLNAALWIVQGLLTAVFVFAGSMKLILPIEVLTSMGSPNQIALPGPLQSVFLQRLWRTAAGASA